MNKNLNIIELPNPPRDKTALWLHSENNSKELKSFDGTQWSNLTNGSNGDGLTIPHVDSYMNVMLILYSLCNSSDLFKTYTEKTTDNAAYFEDYIDKFYQNIKDFPEVFFEKLKSDNGEEDDYVLLEFITNNIGITVSTHYTAKSIDSDTKKWMTVHSFVLNASWSLYKLYASSSAKYPNLGNNGFNIVVDENDKVVGFGGFSTSIT